MGETIVQAGTGQGAPTPRPARQCRFGLRDHVNPGVKIGVCSGYV